MPSISMTTQRRPRSSIRKSMRWRSVDPSSRAVPRCTGFAVVKRRHQAKLGWRGKRGTVPDPVFFPFFHTGLLSAKRGRDRTLLVGNAGGCLPFGGHGAPLAWSATGRKGPGRLANFPLQVTTAGDATLARNPSCKGKFCAPGPPGMAFRRCAASFGDRREANPPPASSDRRTLS